MTILVFGPNRCNSRNIADRVMEDTAGCRSEILAPVQEHGAAAAGPRAGAVL